ncbi:MAG: SDR family oxidoreductase [Thermoleophilia bacterium]|nr:SDR family oxidoreductase [Thermoleophilia bacterium]
MTRLAGHVALVTGAAGALGSTTAERLAADGAAVVCTDIDGPGAEAVAESIRAGGREALALEHDVASRPAWAMAVEAAVDAFGHLDVLVNNAGITRDRTLLKMVDEEWDAVIDVHLRGTYLGCQHGLAAMRERGWGRIVNLSSISAWGTVGQTNYAAAKAGIVGITRTVALEGARYGVLANAIAPGGIDTPMLRAIPTDLFERGRGLVPLGRYGEPGEIAAVAAFLASDDASYLTGQVIHVNGGALLP